MLNLTERVAQALANRAMQRIDNKIMERLRSIDPRIQLHHAQNCMNMRRYPDRDEYYLFDRLLLVAHELKISWKEPRTELFEDGNNLVVEQDLQESPIDEETLEILRLRIDRIIAAEKYFPPRSSL